MARPSPILWQNPDATITLIDIPQSIASAQGTPEISFPYQLLSTPPLSVPFPSTEPKSAKAKARVQATTKSGLEDEELHHQYSTLLKEALEQINSEYTGSWCLPRPFLEEDAPSRRRRRLSDDVATPPPSLPVSNPPNLPNDMLSQLSRQDNAVMTLITPPDPSNQSTNTETTENIDNIHFITNVSPTQSPTLNIYLSNFSYNFHVPPNSSFSLSDCTDSRSFHTHLRDHAQKSNARKFFDFILLDPPWPNRSVRRTHKTPSNSAYSILSTPSDIRDLLSDLQLDRLMSETCLLAIWITNKAIIREPVLAENGLFDCWDMELAEEWLWLKTTVSGEPVLPCDGIGRKPYEVLLLARKRQQNSTCRDQSRPKRRVVFAVPDLHSRKPCIKELIEPLLPDAKNYRALEIFARYLVAGWCSWGDECIKFNWEGYWRKIDHH